MNVSLYIAKRYLFAKKSHNIINIISIISFTGVAVATAVLFIVLSIFNGLQNFVEQSFNSFSADIEITPKYGKIISENAIDLKQISSLQGVEYISEVLSDVAVFVNDDKQSIAKIKGVYPDYKRMNRLDTTICNGQFLLENRGYPFAVLGIGVAAILNCQVSGMLSNTLKIYYPDRTKKTISTVSIDALNAQVISPAGVFRSSSEYDMEYVFVPLSFARTLLGYESGFTSLEIRCKSDDKIENVQNEIKKMIGEDFYVKNSYQQEEELFKVMQSEKWITYSILSFILLIASFNMIGMIAILILEKKRSAGIFHSMGADTALVRRIFIYEGVLISVLGVIIGLFFGLIFCLLQIHFGFITFGEGTYLLEVYPVDMQWKDVLLIPFIVLAITVPSAWFLTRKIFKRIYPIIILFLFVGCQMSVKQTHLEGFTMGTYYSIKYYDLQNRNLQKEIDSLLTDFDNTASIYNKMSIISRINRNEDNVLLNDDFIKLYTYSKEVSEQTNGTFDMTVGQLVNAWGFGSEKKQTMTKDKIDSLLPCIGYEKIELKNGKLIKQNPCIKLDFNAIAKGYAVDKIGMFLNSLHIDNYLIDIGGEVLGKGNKNGEAWVVGIEKPSKDKGDFRQVLIQLPLNNMSLVTSGNYRKYYEEDGIRYAHTISPQTGYPVDNTLLSVTVLSPTATFGDAYATAFMVMGMDTAIEFIKQRKDIEAYFIYQKSDSIFTYSTKGFF